MRNSTEREPHNFQFRSEFSKGRFPLSLSWILLSVLLFSLFVFVTFPGEAAADNVAWWDSLYCYRKQLTVTNVAAFPLPSGYSLHLSLDHSSLVAAGQSLASGDDVRIVYWDGFTNTELDRVNESNWNSMIAFTQIWFRTQVVIPEGGADSGYFIYYGNQHAAGPPSNRRNIYEFFDDFSNYSPGTYNLSTPGTSDIMRDGGEPVWKIQSGAWTIENDTQADGTTGKILSNDALSGVYNYAYAIGRTYDNVVVEVKMRTPPGETGQYWPFGARLDVSSGANYTAWSYSDHSNILEFSSWSVQSSLVAGNLRPPMGNAWHTLQFCLDGKKLESRFDGSTYGCYAEDTTLTSGAVFVMASAFRKVHFDNFKVRKYTSDEPSVMASEEEKLLSKPTISFGKKWRLKSDGHTPADQFISVTVNYPETEGLPDMRASYEIVGTGLSDTLPRIAPSSWGGEIDISGLSTGTYHMMATVGDSSQQRSSNLSSFYISFPFYHVWTIDWEGEYRARVPYLNDLAALADEHGTPMTQLFNPRVYVRPGMPEWQKAQMTQWILERAQTKGDEIGVHLHMFYDFVDSAGLTPITEPCWGNCWGGYDVPFANYDYEQSLALLDLAIELFEGRGLGRPTTFRAGGWFADEANLKALSDLGFSIDASGGIYPGAGVLPLPWNLDVTSQPYHPCAEEQNASDCQPYDSNLPIWEMPNNLGSTTQMEDTRPYFDTNYEGAPFDFVRVGVLLSHDGSASGEEKELIEEHFAHVDNFLYSRDRGAVIYATLADVREALSGLIPDSPDSLGPPDLVSGEPLENRDEPFAFRIHDRDSLDSVRYRIQISLRPDYNPSTGLIVDYVSPFFPQGFRHFCLGQPDSSGTYYVGSAGQTFASGAYYWRVMAINSRGRSSSWTTARKGAVAFTVEQTADVGGSKSPAAPLAVSFCNPSGPSVLFRTQVPAADKATLKIFNCAGRLLRVLPLYADHVRSSGVYWDGRDSNGKPVSSGVYFIELNQGRQTVSKKLVLVK